MRPGNLLTLRVIKCKTCYDLGEIVNLDDHGKRKPCKCRSKKKEANLCS